MADMRRTNLRESLVALRERKIEATARRALTSRRNKNQREALLCQPEREDERLTNPSVDSTLQKVLAGGLTDPGRANRLQEKQERVQAHEAVRRENKQDSLHTLYMQARSFITTEAQLAQAIDAEFGTPKEPREFESQSSIWYKGAPQTVQEKINAINNVRTPGSERGALGGTESYAEITRARLKKMAEHLTGGKMDSEDSGRG